MKPIALRKWTVLACAVASAFAATLSDSVGASSAFSADSSTGSVAAASTSHYLYAEDGTCPDGVDVFSLSGTNPSLVQHVQVGCATVSPLSGAHQLAVTKSTGAHGPCLIIADAGNRVINSFAIDSRTGLLAGPLSAVPGGSSPTDIRISPDANTAFAMSAGTLFVIRIGSACGLTEAKTNGIASRGLIALETSNTLATTTDTIDTYSIGADGSLTQVGSVPDQLQVVQYHRTLAGVDVMSVSTTAGTVRNLYTGSMASGGSNPTMAQGFQATPKSLTPLFGSPAVDSGFSYALNGGPIVMADQDHMLLIQANPDNGLGAGNVVGWYTVTAGTPGFPGRIALGGNTPLAAGAGGNVPVLMARLGAALYVGEQSNGEIDACQVSTAGVSNCRQVATLTGAGTGSSGPLAVS
jgi:hypothetical protein